MKKLFTLALIATLSLTILGSCDKEENPEDFLGSITIQLQLKTGLSNISLEGIGVLAVNVQDNTERTALTNTLGIAEFTAIPAGTYNINISQEMEDGEYSVTGAQSNVVVNMKENTPVTVTVDAVNPEADFVIKEVYYPGAADSYVSLFKDQFIEIFNNSSEVLYADSLYIGHLFLERPQTSQAPLAASHDITQHVYAEIIEQVPGTGKQYPIQPGKSFVIALNAINFKEGNPQPEKAVDNSSAEFERYSVTWLEDQGRMSNSYFDLDNPDVPNMTNIYLAEKHAIIVMEINGPGIVIFKRDTPFDASDVYNYQYTNQSGTPAEINLVKIAVENVIDGVEIMENSTLGDWKRMPAAIDGSFTYLKADGGAFYSGMSLRRKVNETATSRFGRVVLQDTNNSSSDFESINTPDPKGYDNM